MLRTLVLLVFVFSLFNYASEVLISGNAFNLSDPNFSDNLNRLDHTFSLVGQPALASTDLTGFDVVWLDGFSSYEGLSPELFTAFLARGGTLVVQNPGFGGNNLASYPGGTQLSATYVEAGFGNVLIANGGTFITAGLDDAALSNWAPTAGIGYFQAIDGFTGIATDGTPGNWVTILGTGALGRVVYTHQPIAQALAAGPLTLSSGPLRLLNNLLTDSEPLTLTPPLFCQNAHFWREADGKLVGLLPDPDSDGLDGSGTRGLGYAFWLVANGNVVAGPTALTGPWPKQVEIAAASMPSAPYTMAIARTAAGLEDSAPLWLPGPAAQAADPGVLRHYRRWLIHAPRKAGGFSALVRLINENPNEAIDAVLVGFANDGRELATETLRLAPGQRRDLQLYGAGMDGIFVQPELLDQVSHIAVWDERGVARASLRYVADSTGFGVWTQALDLERELVSGRRFHLDGASPNTGYYDGVALLNLSASVTPRILIHRFDENGSTAGTLDLGTLAPGAKRLSALSFAYPDYLPDASYEIEVQSENPSARIQIFGLSGATSGQFFAPANAVRLE